MSPADSLQPYMGWSGDASEGAVLVFAHHRQQAKALAHGVMRAWGDIDYTDVRVRRMRDHEPWLQRLANPEALAAGRAHVVDDPASCDRCETWGIPLLETGICVACDAAERDANAERAGVH